LPQLVEFQRANPKLTMNVTSGPRSADLLRLEADLSVQLQRPKEPNLKVMKLGCLHVTLFAARSYLEACGTPASVADLKNHHFAVLADAVWEDGYRRIFGDLSPDGLVTLRNTSSAGHFWSVVKGAGIGALPTYCMGLGANLVPLDFGGTAIDSTDIWLAYHPDAKRAARIQRTIEWLVQCYDPRRYPWFRDEYIHPDRFSEMYKGGPLAGTFADLGMFS